MANSRTLSVVTICQNAKFDLMRTVHSVRNQIGASPTLYEHLVCDGGSSDGTLQYCVENQLDVVSESDHGISDAFNKGIESAKGDYILFLNAGDVLLDGALEKVLSVLQVDGGEWYVFSLARARKSLLGRLVGLEVFNLVPTKLLVTLLLYRNFIPHPAAVVKRENLIKAGGFDSSLKVAMDYDLWFRLLLQGACPVFHNRKIVEFDEGGISYHRKFSERAAIRRRWWVYSFKCLFRF